MPCRQHAAVMTQPHLPPSCPTLALPAAHAGRERPSYPGHGVTPVRGRCRRPSGRPLPHRRGGKVVTSQCGRPARCRSNTCQHTSVLPLKTAKREAAAQRRPAKRKRKNRVFPRNDRPYGLERTAFQTENARGQRLQEILATQGEKPFSCLRGRPRHLRRGRPLPKRLRCSRHSCGPALPARRRSPAPRRGTSIRHCDGKAPRK